MVMKLQRIRVFLYIHPGSEVTYSSESFGALHDALEFVHWLSCQVSTPFYYRVVRFSFADGFKKIVLSDYRLQKPTICKYYPSRPLLLSIKKKRIREKLLKGYYYVY